MMFLMVVAMFAAAERFEGTVKVGGPPTQRTVEVWGAGVGVDVAGALRDEVARLHGVTVALIGTRSGDSFAAERYEIVDIGGGRKPLVGILRMEDGRLALVGEETVLLWGARRTRDSLAKRVGAKVWVHGSKINDRELKVLRYGVLVEEAEKK
jgi:hypothetical protein